MLTIIKESEYVDYDEYELVFYREPGYGFGFPCDKDGNLLPGLTDAAIENHRWALEHKEKFPYAFNEIEHRVRHCREPAIGKCRCGSEFPLENQYQGACECPGCGQWYNLFGQELRDPSTWEREWW